MNPLLGSGMVMGPNDPQLSSFASGENDQLNKLMTSGMFPQILQMLMMSRGLQPMGMGGGLSGGLNASNIGGMLGGLFGSSMGPFGGILGSIAGKGVGSIAGKLGGGIKRTIGGLFN